MTSSAAVAIHECPMCHQSTDAPLDFILLTRAQAAARCGVGVNKIDDWSEEPGFPIIREPHFVRIHAGRLDEWLGNRAEMTNHVQFARRERRRSAHD